MSRTECLEARRARRRPAGRRIIEQTSLIVVLALLAGALPGRVGAHNQPKPIEQWGPFLPGAQSCLRAISRAAHTCFDTALALRQACRDAELRGEACDRDALDEAIGAATSATRAVLADNCTSGDLTELNYIG